MKNQTNQNIANTLTHLFNDAKNDRVKMMKGLAKGLFRPIQPIDFEHVYLSISQKQGEYLVDLIQEKNLKNIVEFGTSFGISTLFLAQGIQATDGHIITTELIESKAKKALENFKRAGVENQIEIRIGDAMETLKGHDSPIDLLFLDGWKDLYSPLFHMLEPNFHAGTIIYVDNAEMPEAQSFLQQVQQSKNYKLASKFNHKVLLITPIK